MKILFIGDIVGKSGRLAVKEQLPVLKDQFNPDFIIANAENAAHGKGITPKIFHELLSYGIDCITMGNHTYAKSNISEIIEDRRLVTPLNYKKLDKGGFVSYFDICSQRVGVVNLLGTVFMEREVTDPYKALEDVLERDTLYFVDFHAEATGEKATFARYFKEKLIACLGTHTHVQTADERLFGNCGFISDVGMCGCYESILGRDIEEVTNMAITQTASRYTIAEGPYEFSAVLLTVRNKKCEKIERIHIIKDM